jgi:integrating conjugative element membrane protein (TIGR03747 family)
LASRNASFHERGFAGLLLTPLKWACLSFALLFGLLLAAWIIDWVLVFRVWSDGAARLQDVLSQDLARIHNIACWCGDLPKLAVGTANFLYDLIFRVSGIHDMGVRFAEGAALSIPDTIALNVYVANFMEIQMAMMGTQLFGVRLATLLVAMPLIVLCYGVALTDGLVQRAIRCASGGRESGSLYHRAKYLQLVLMVSFAAVWLLLLEPIDSRFIWVLALAIEAILVRIQWAYYKKYL